MTDVSLPFFGNPKESRKADKARERRKVALYEDTWIDAFLKGMFGDDAPSNSVLDPQYDKNRTASEIGQRVGVVTDIASPVKAGLLGALPALAGAIRFKGAKDLVATHATNPDSLSKILESGKLKAPSIGITARQTNDYSSNSPQFVFAAGKTDPERIPGALINRDGYFSNPKGDHMSLEEEIKLNIMRARQTYGLNDQRLQQFFPGGSQGFAIGASPSFKSYKEFEQSPYGARLLRVPEKERSTYWNALERDLRDEAHWAGKEVEDYARGIIKKMNDGTAEVARVPGHIAQLWDRAKNSPSAMAEFKLHEHLPISPADTALYIPRGAFTESTFRQLEGYRDNGFKIFNPWNMMNEKDFGRSPFEWEGKRLPNVAKDDGTFSLPPNLMLPQKMYGNPSSGMPSPHEFEMWNDFWGKQSAPPLPRTKNPPGMIGAGVHKLDIEAFETPQEAEKAFQKLFDMGQFNEADFQAGLKAIDQKWPVKAPGETSDVHPELLSFFAKKPDSPKTFAETNAAELAKVQPPKLASFGSKNTLEHIEPDIFAQPSLDLAENKAHKLLEDGIIDIDQYGEIYGKILDHFIMGKLWQSGGQATQ